MVTRPTTRSLLILLGFFTLLTLAACSALNPKPAPLPTVVLPTSAKATSTNAPTHTPEPTETPLPSVTPTITATLPPTAVPSVTPDPSLAEIKLIGLAWMPRYEMLLSFQFPTAVDAAKYRVTLEDKEYRCEVLAQYPNRLYCFGQGAKVLTTAMVRLYQAGSTTPAFEKEMWIPYFAK
jgi:hypothetical protein